MTTTTSRRRIPGTDCVAVLTYASTDRTVRHYRIELDNGVILGYVAAHSKSLARSAGYHEGTGVWTFQSTNFRNLAEAAEYFMEVA